MSRELRQQIEDVEHQVAMTRQTLAAEEVTFVAARDQLLVTLAPLRAEADTAARTRKHAEVRCEESEQRLAVLAQKRVGAFSRRHNVMHSPAAWLTLPLLCFGWLPVVAIGKVFGAPWELGVAGLGVAGLVTGILLGRYVGVPKVALSSTRLLPGE